MIGVEKGVACGPLVAAIEEAGEVEIVWDVEAACGSERKRVLRRAWMGDGVDLVALGSSRRSAR